MKPSPKATQQTVPCRSCGAPMVFVLTRKGHRMPIDPAPVTNGKGNLVLQQGLGDELPTAIEVEPGKGTHVSHFATCPNAPQHRKKR